jgi:hypothetical protein
MEKRNAYRIQAGKFEVDRPHRRSRHKQEVNIKMDIGGTGCKGCGLLMTQDTDHFVRLV